MLRHIRFLTTFAVALAVIGGQANTVLAQVSAPAEGSDIKSVLDRLGRMEKSLAKEMQESFGKVAFDIDNAKKQISDLKVAVDILKGQVVTLNVGIEKNDSRVETLEAQVRSLNKTIAQLEQTVAKLSSNSYVAKSAPPAPTAGRVFLVNMYSEDMTFIINQKSYPLRANTSQMVESVPPGSLIYEVFSPTWGRRGFSATTLPAGETLTLTAR